MSAEEATLDNPILNGPYDPPALHWEMGPKGPTGQTVVGRRPSESFVPVAPVKKGANAAIQEEIDFEGTAERVDQNTLINDLRRDVDLWRANGYQRVNAITRKLLLHWADPKRENRVLFCQREAVETGIFLHEVAGRDNFIDWRKRLEPFNDEFNLGLPRVALKMATGTGKTVVMAMLIAWQTANKVQTPQDARFSKRFLIIAPGITIRDRLRVLQPSDPGNYYKERDLLPPDMHEMINQAQIVITNYHAFLPRDVKEIKGVAANTRKLLLAGKKVDPFKETEDQTVDRVLRSLGTKKDGEVIVLNDEAHHCYRDKPEQVEGEVLDPSEKKEAKQANEDARVWFRGLQAVKRRLGVKVIYDLSATPYFLKGSGYHEGFIFPWTVSDFSLMDAIESGIVKVPRTPVDDDAEGKLVTYLHLWDQIGDELPKRSQKDAVGKDPMLPFVLEGALRSLYANYEKAWKRWEKTLKAEGEPPPVFIVVCPNTVVSKLVYDWIAGYEKAVGETTIKVKGNLPLFSNVVKDKLLGRPNTILVDSAQLESGEALKGDFKTAAAAEVEAFKNEWRRRNPGGDAEKITDEDILREVLNTVGKRGMLGEQIRCVVSVSMLTEGWDANTVTHILGIRPFRSQLLCEQVVGRGLRRRSYAVDEDTGHFAPEYSNIYGIPFAFIPSDKVPGPEQPPKPVTLVESLPGREHLRIEFPRLDGYRLEIPDEPILVDLDNAPPFPVDSSTVPHWVKMSPIVGEEELHRLEMESRPRQVAFVIAKRVLDRWFSEGGPQTWRFPELVEATLKWIDQCVEVGEGHGLGILMLAEAQAKAAEQVYGAIVRQEGNRRERLRPLMRRYDPVGDTGSVSFPTRKPVYVTQLSEVSHVVLDSGWEGDVAAECEQLSDLIESYVKNDHLGFTIPYVHMGKTHDYVPDFLLRLKKHDADDVVRTLIIEVSGGLKDPGLTAAKAETARNSWCAAVNNAGRFGRWGYVEFTTMANLRTQMKDAIAALYDDEALIGDPESLDFTQTHTDEVLSGTR